MCNESFSRSSSRTVDGSGPVFAAPCALAVDAGNPNFAKLDEVLFIAGESSLRLAENRGKQKTKEKTAEQLRQDARVYLSRLVAGYPNSAFLKQAEDDLKALGGPVKPDATTP